MSLPSLALDSAVGSGIYSFVAHPGTARQWYLILYSPHKRNKQGSTTRERPMACQHPASYVSCWLTEEMYYQYIAKFRGSKDVSFAYLGCARAGFD